MCTLVERDDGLYDSDVPGYEIVIAVPVVDGLSSRREYQKVFSFGLPLVQ